MGSGNDHQVLSTEVCFYIVQVNKALRLHSVKKRIHSIGNQMECIVCQMNLLSIPRNISSQGFRECG